MKRYIPLILILPLVCGCMVSGYDATTGERIWGPLSQADAATRPTTNPATGNPVVVVADKKMDAEAAWWIAYDAAQKAAGASGPWGEVIAGAAAFGGLLVGAWWKEKARRREREALFTPAPTVTVTPSPPPDVNDRQL